MPTFLYTIARGLETKTTELRRSNPQGWLLDAMRATFPDVASRRAGDVMRLRLERVGGLKETWRAVLVDEPSDVSVHVMKLRR